MATRYTRKRETLKVDGRTDGRILRRPSNDIITSLLPSSFVRTCSFDDNGKYRRILINNARKFFNFFAPTPEVRLGFPARYALRDSYSCVRI